MTSLEASEQGVWLRVDRPEHKFSCAHMTIFPAGTKERLHGHNFQVAAAVQLGELRDELQLDFAQLKAVMASLCAELREHMLIAAHSPHVKVLSGQGPAMHVVVCGKRYAFPADEVLLLPIANVVVEQLAVYLWQRVYQAMAELFDKAGVRAMEVTVTESPGQGASYRAACQGAAASGGSHGN